MHLVLASRSPRRSDLLTRAGYRFEVAPADIDERRLDGEAPAAMVRRLAREKAAAVTSHEEWKAERFGQQEIPRAQLVEKLRELLAE